MGMDQAAVWLAGSILIMLGFIVIVLGVLIINNLFSKYWKPVTLTKYNYHSVYYDPVTGEQLIAQPPNKKEESA
jgi:hypothetical protein